MPNFEPQTEAEDTVTPDLNEVASVLGEVYFIRKEAEDEQKILREEFFEQVAAAYEDPSLARKAVEIPEDIIRTAPTDDEVRAFAEKYNPGWRVVGISTKGVKIKVIVEEDPNLKQHSEVVRLEPWEVSDPTKANPNRTKRLYGYVITKTVRSGTIQVDDERLKRADPELYHVVTEFRDAWRVYELAESLGKDRAWAGEWMIGHDWPVVIRDDLTPEEVEELKPYMFESAKTLALNVRYAKEDETNASS